MDPWLCPFSPSPTGYLQACRALMITAILLGFLGLLFGVLGLRCTNVGSIVLSRKAKLAATAGALHILTGNGQRCPFLLASLNFPVQLFSLALPSLTHTPSWHMFPGWHSHFGARHRCLREGVGVCLRSYSLAVRTKWGALNTAPHPLLLRKSFLQQLVLLWPVVGGWGPTRLRCRQMWPVGQEQGILNQDGPRWSRSGGATVRHALLA